MLIKIEQKGERYLVLFTDGETEVKGLYLTRSELRKLNSNINEIIEYGNEEAGDDI